MYFVLCHYLHPLLRYVNLTFEICIAIYVHAQLLESIVEIVHVLLREVGPFSNPITKMNKVDFYDYIIPCIVHKGRGLACCSKHAWKVGHQLRPTLDINFVG